jgi:glycosyltransferase involved in cell wall biosynthesis
MARQISPLSDLRSLWRLVGVLRSARPDVLQTATPKASLLGAIAARMCRVPVVVIGLFGLPQMTQSGWRRRLLDATTRVSTSAATTVWCDSRSMAAYVRDQSLAPRDRVRVIGEGSVGGVDAAGAFDPETRAAVAAGARVRAGLGIPQEAKVLGFVGRLTRDKGMLELGEAWRSLRARHPEAHLVLVGPEDGDFPEGARRLLAPDAHTHLVGGQRHVTPYFAAMDVFVMPSYREGFCVTNLEASAMALPVVATRIPGCVDSVADGVTGTLVPVRDSTALANAIDVYLRDPEMASRHGRAGRARAVHDFDPRAMQTELASAYRDLLHSGELTTATSPSGVGGTRG